MVWESGLPPEVVSLSNASHLARLTSRPGQAPSWICWCLVTGIRAILTKHYCVPGNGEAEA